MLTEDRQLSPLPEWEESEEEEEEEQWEESMAIIAMTTRNKGGTEQRSPRTNCTRLLLIIVGVVWGVRLTLSSMSILRNIYMYIYIYIYISTRLFVVNRYNKMQYNII